MLKFILIFISILLLLFIIFIYSLPKFENLLGKKNIVQKPTISNLSDEGCLDSFNDCKKWAKNKECSVNPEYMLFNCAKSCYACNMKDEEKNNLVKYYNSKMPIKEIYHGESYPDRLQDLNELYYYNYESDLT